MIARLVAHWRDDAPLLEALARLPDRLDEAAHVPVSVAVDTLLWADSAMVVGRGLGFAVALEAALKLKETCAIQAEAFSGAEIRHGPLALVEHGYPLIIFALRGAEQSGLIDLARDLRQRGARVILAAPSGVADRDLTLEIGDDPTLDPILAIQTFYVLAARLAKARGLNPDEPPNLTKVTLTH